MSSMKSSETSVTGEVNNHKEKIMKFCLIGSTRFMGNYVEANRELTLMGHIVYTVATISTASAMKSTDESPITEEQKEVLDLVHLKKILESEAVCLITDETGYYGPSTRREMMWATMNNKPILVFVPTKPKARMFQWTDIFRGIRLLDIPTPEKLAEGWRECVSEEALASSESIRIPGGEA